MNINCLILNMLKLLDSVVIDSLFIVPPIVCLGSVFGPWIVMHYLVSFLVLQSYW